MSDLTEFLLARIAEDEIVAHAAAKRPIVARGRWGLEKREQIGVTGITVQWYREDDGWSGSDSGRFDEGFTHFARFDEKRVLAECEAKRRIVELHVDNESRAAAYRSPRWADGMNDEDRLNWRKAEARVGTTGYVLRLLALPYADHPDYREEWRP